MSVSTDNIETHEKWLTTSPEDGGLGPVRFHLASDIDGTMIGQALTNLIKNAGEAMDARAVATGDSEWQPEIRIALEEQDTEIVITIEEVYSQCARAMMRSGLWGDIAAPDLPTVGALLAEAKDSFDGKTYDAEWGARAAETMW